MRRSSSVKRPPVSPILESARELSSIDGSSIDDFSTTSSSSLHPPGVIDTAAMVTAQQRARKDSLLNYYNQQLAMPPLAPPPQRKTSLGRAGGVQLLTVPELPQQMLSHANPAAFKLNNSLISSSSSSLNSTQSAHSNSSTEVNQASDAHGATSSTQSAPATAAPNVCGAPLCSTPPSAGFAAVDSPVRAGAPSSRTTTSAQSSAQSSPVRKDAVSSAPSPFELRTLGRNHSRSSMFHQSSGIAAANSITANLRRICFLITHDEQKKGGPHGSLHTFDQPSMESSASSPLSETPPHHASAYNRQTCASSYASQTPLYISGNFSSSASAKTLPMTARDKSSYHFHKNNRNKVNSAGRLRFMRNETKSESSLFERVLSMGRSGASHSVCAVQPNTGKKPVVKELFTLTGLTLGGGEENGSSATCYEKQEDSSQAESPKPWECASALDPNVDFDWRRVVREIVFAHTIQSSRRLTKAQSEDHAPGGGGGKSGPLTISSTSRTPSSSSSVTAAGISRRSTNASLRSIFSSSSSTTNNNANPSRAGRALSRQSAMLLSSQQTLNQAMQQQQQQQQQQSAAALPKHRRQFDFFYSDDSNAAIAESKRGSVSSNATTYHQQRHHQQFSREKNAKNETFSSVVQRQTSCQSSISGNNNFVGEEENCLDCYCTGCQACDDDDAFAATTTTSGATFSGHYENSNGTLCQHCAAAAAAAGGSASQQLSGTKGGQTTVIDPQQGSNRNILPRYQSLSTEDSQSHSRSSVASRTSNHRLQRNTTLGGPCSHVAYYNQRRPNQMLPSSNSGVMRADSIRSRRKPFHDRRDSIDSVSSQQQPKLSTDSLERPPAEALRARRTALPSSNLLEHPSSPTKLERQLTKKQIPGTSNLVTDSTNSDVHVGQHPQLMNGIQSMPNAALVNPSISNRTMDDEQLSTSTICSTHRRRSSVVIIPPMHVCPGDLLIYPHTSLFRSVPEMEPSSYRSTDSLNSLTSMSNNEGDNIKAGRNKWGFLKLFTDKSRGKSDSLSQITEATTQLAQKIQSFQDEQLVRYKALHWSELTRELGEQNLKLSSDEQKRREAVWNCFQSELSYFLDYLLVMKHLYLETLKNMQVEGHLMRVEPEKLFGNLAELIYIIGNFCLDFIARLPSSPEDNVDIFMDPDMLEDVYDKLLPGTGVALVDIEHRYCLNYIGALNYLEQLRKSDSFCEFERICGQDKRCKRLQLQDLLVTPVQHCCKRPLLLRDIIKYTVKSGKDAAPLERLLDQFEASLRDIDDKMSWLKNYERIQAIQRRLIWPPVTELQDPKLNIPEILRPLLTKQPCDRLLLSPRRALLHEGPTLCYEGNKPIDYQLFLFDDMILLCKKQKALTKKQKPSSSLTESSSRSDSPSHDEPFRYVVRGQPMPLDRIMVHDLNTEAHNDNRLRLALVIIEINRFQQLISVNTVYSPSEAAKVMWLSKIRHAMERWKIEHGSNITLRSNSGSNAGGGPHYRHVHHNNRRHQLLSQNSVTSMNAAGGTPPSNASFLSRTMSLRRSNRNAPTSANADATTEETSSIFNSSATVLPPSNLVTSVSPTASTLLEQNDDFSTHARRLGSLGTSTRPPRRAINGTGVSAWPPPSGTLPARPRRPGLVHQQSVASALGPKPPRDELPPATFHHLGRGFSTPPGGSNDGQNIGKMFNSDTNNSNNNNVAGNCADFDSDATARFDLNKSIGI